MDEPADISETDPSPANAAVIAVESETQQTQEDEPPSEPPKEPPEDLQDGVPHEVVPSKALSEGDEEETAHKPKSVPIWKLFRFSTPLDVVMIVVGAVMGVLSGVALPGHFLLFGEVINQFVYYTIATETIRPRISDFIDARNNTAYQTVDDIACNSTRADEAISMLSDNGTRVYLCTGGDQGGAVFSEVLGYICDPADELQAQIAVYAYYYVGLALAVLLSTFLANALLNMSGYRQTRRMRLAFFRNVLHQEIGWFDVTDSAELSTRLADDIEKIQSGIGDKVAVFLSYFSTFVTGYVIAFTRSWKMALVVMTMLPLLATVGAIMSRIVASFTAREQSAYAAAGSVAEEVLSAIRTVVAFGGENKEAERYGEQLKKARNVGVKKSIFTATAVGSLYFIMFNTFALGFWYGSQLILDCELSAGDVVTVFFSVVLGSFSLGNALPEIQTFAVAFGAASAVFEVIDKESKIDTLAGDGETPDDLSGDIEFRDVVFHYPARPDVRVLKGLSLKIIAGQTVALVGPSGCGKSTTVQLIQRFYDTDDGQITIDGREIKSLNLKWLRSNIGIVSQEPVLFNMSIADNIRLGKEGVDMDGIRQAAKNANAHNFISALPNGYDTLVGERGSQLSGGQKQRIAIARALVRNPKILLLDEATSALDTESEKIVQEALDKAREGRTSIVIAHRLSTIYNADRIAVIHNGKVIESGTHSTLMSEKGAYYHLNTVQLKDFDED
ncbi:ATP-dependent translocase ABCB1 [Geodia barretti]|uniref:ATP-dependent translocase ABCB1 n=1 Tax=Geodia barretti TaxID=519541 RepID=A0AA35U1Y6_GEOBA|nr:ATP-dependent translocase ABCB1 [Geodia barretti]